MVPFLAELRSRDVQLWADGDRLRCTAPAGVLTPELRSELQRRKDEILQLLRSADALASQQRAIVPLQPQGHRAPVFAVAGHNGDVFCYRDLARHLGSDQPFFGLQPPGVDGDSAPMTSVTDLAAHFAAQIRAFRPHGPYVIAGYCAGGTIAYELSQQLVNGGADVSHLVLFASPYPTWYRPASQMRHALAQVIDRSWAERWQSLTRKFRERRATRAAAPDPVLIRRHEVEKATVAAVRRYEPAPFSGAVSFFIPGDRWLPDATPRWRKLVRSAGEYCAPRGCRFDQMLREPYVTEVAALFRRSREHHVLSTRD